MTDPAEGARAVLWFWFDEVGQDRWFIKDPALDAEIARRFGTMRQDVLDGQAAGWREQPETMLAAIILLDQFTRNIFRGKGRAFEADNLALSLSFEALDRGYREAMTIHQQAFLLMPLMHSEDPAVQARSVEEFRRLGEPTNLGYAIKHQEQVERFGRFPGRNRALGRVSSTEEKAAIERGEVF